METRMPGGIVGTCQGRVKRWGGFTLVELLIVIAILSLLLSLLMPTLSKSRELTRRALCASRQNQIVTTITTYAAENRQLFPVTIRDDKNEHCTFLPKDLYYTLRDDYGTGREYLECPNKTDWFRIEGAGARVGYYVLFGHTTPWGDPNPWDSPKGLGETRRLPMTTDVIEKGTVTPNYTSSSHGQMGPVHGPFATPLEPEVIGSQGGITSYTDGSVSWRDQEELLERRAIKGGTIHGYW